MEPVSSVASTIAPLVPVAVSVAPPSTLSSEVTAVAIFAATSATDCPLIEPVASTLTPLSWVPSVIVSDSGLPIPALKLTSCAATSATAPSAWIDPPALIAGAASRIEPMNPAVKPVAMSADPGLSTMSPVVP